MYPSRRSSAGVRQRPQAEGRGASSVMGRARRAVATRIRDVHNPPRRACSHGVEQVRIHQHRARVMRGAARPSHARPIHGVRWKVKDPVRCGLVLPRTRLEQVPMTGPPARRTRSAASRESVRPNTRCRRATRTLTSSEPMNPAAPVTNVVARVSVAMGPVCSVNEAAPTDNTRTEPHDARARGV